MRRPRALPLAALPVLVLAAAGCRTVPPAPPCDCSQVLAGASTSCAPLDLAGVAAAPAPGWENLVFEGGGVKGVAYAGALDVLDAAGGLAGVERVAGTSAGSITALLVALGYTPAEVESIVLGLDFRMFEDGTFLTDLERFFRDYGWYPADTATCLFECLVERKLGDRQATFADLHARAASDPALRDLYVVSTDLERRAWVVFSHESAEYADLPLARGVRASMAIPFFFTAQRIGGEVFVDGGVMRNYAIDLFDRRDPVDATLGFFLGSLPAPSPVGDLEQYTEQVFESILGLQTANLCADETNVRRSVFIDPLGISTTDFAITRAQKCALIESGARGTRQHLEAPATECPQRLAAPDPRPAGAPAGG